MLKWAVQLHSSLLSFCCCCSSLPQPKGSSPVIFFVATRTGLLDMRPDFQRYWNEMRVMVEEKIVQLLSSNWNILYASFFRNLANILCYKWYSYSGENSASIGAAFYVLSSRVKLLCLFNSRLTFLNVGCCDSVRKFRCPVTCTWGFFAHALFFKVETINNLVSKCFWCCTKICLSGIFSLLSILAFVLQEKNFLLFMIGFSFFMLSFPFPLEVIYLRKLNT